LLIEIFIIGIQTLINVFNTMIVEFIKFKQWILFLTFLTQSFLYLCSFISNGHKFHKIYLFCNSSHHLIFEINQLCWISSNSILWNICSHSKWFSLLLLSFLRIVNHKGNILILIRLGGLIPTHCLWSNELSRALRGWGWARLELYWSFAILGFA